MQRTLLCKMLSECSDERSLEAANETQGLLHLFVLLTAFTLKAPKDRKKINACDLIHQPAGSRFWPRAVSDLLLPESFWFQQLSMTDLYVCVESDEHLG